jgi:ABC-type glutathione transport system ATPase component
MAKQYNKVRKDGQMSMDAEKVKLPGDVIDAIEEMLELKQSAKNYSKASRRVKEAIPQVEPGEKRQFFINDKYLVDATAFEVDAHEVRGGRRQRNKIAPATT